MVICISPDPNWGEGGGLPPPTRVLQTGTMATRTTNSIDGQCLKSSLVY
jgi:hypothetical protein